MTLPRVFPSDSCLQAYGARTQSEIVLQVGPPKVYQSFVNIARSLSPWIPALLPLIRQALAETQPRHGAVVVCWTANDCLARPKSNRKNYNWAPKGDLAHNVNRLLASLSNVPRCLLVLAGSAPTWRVTKGSEEYENFIAWVQPKAHAMGISCVDGTTWHGSTCSHRTSNGGHTVDTPQSAAVFSWLLRASAAYAVAVPGPVPLLTVNPLVLPLLTLSLSCRMPRRLLRHRLLTMMHRT